MPSHARARRGGVISGTVGVVGELLITVGVLLGLFVVWQLWWTDVEAVAAHREIVSELTFAPAPEKVATEHHEEPPVAEQPPFGATFATFYVPRWGTGYEEPITQGVNKKQILDPKGIGHYPDTQMPGELGNFAIAGHRTTFGKPFARVDELQAGDPLVVRTADTWYVYRVTSHQIVYPREYDVVSPVPNTPFGDPNVKRDNRYITLTACHPRFSARQRFVVHGTLAYWSPVSEGTPKELVDAGVKVTVGSSSTANGAS